MKLEFLCPAQGASSDDAVWRLSVWRLSRTSGRRAACAAGRLDGAYWLIGPGPAGLAFLDIHIYTIFAKYLSVQSSLKFLTNAFWIVLQSSLKPMIVNLVFKKEWGVLRQSSCSRLLYKSGNNCESVCPKPHKRRLIKWIILDYTWSWWTEWSRTVCRHW